MDVKRSVRVGVWDVGVYVGVGGLGVWAGEKVSLGVWVSVVKVGVRVGVRVVEAVWVRVGAPVVVAEGEGVGVGLPEGVLLGVATVERDGLRVPVVRERVPLKLAVRGRDRVKV